MSSLVSTVDQLKEYHDSKYGKSPEVGSLKLETAALLLKTIDQVNADKVEMEIRLEGQLQETEISLLDTAEENDDLTRELNQVKAEAQELMAKAKNLEEQLSVAEQEKARLSALLWKYRDEVYTLKGKVKVAERAREMINSQLTSTEDRMVFIKKKLAHVGVLADLDRQIDALEIRRQQLLPIINDHDDIRAGASGAVALSGFMVGGPFGAVGAFFGYQFVRRLTVLRASSEARSEYSTIERDARDLLIRRKANIEQFQASMLPKA